MDAFDPCKGMRWRKAQKKAKRRKYTSCLSCGEKYTAMVARKVMDDISRGWWVEKKCRCCSAVVVLK